jgi:hypothetical protein
VVALILAGSDVGELGDGHFRELEREVTENGRIDLFCDARAVRGVSIDVSGGWATWMAEHREHLRSIHMLTGSRFVQLTARFVRSYAALVEQMRIYTDAPAFEAALDECCAAAIAAR